MEKAISILKKHSLRKTPFRLEVLSLFLDNATKGISPNFIENSVKDFDRITLYRTLKTFEKSGVIHMAIDGSNDTKYALCHEDCSTHNHIDDHAHFLCTDCGETYCLENVIQPQITLPANYKLTSAHLALSGLCKNCNLQ
jgi:Fur family ferric uptake transcriptional regulator